MHQLDVLKKTTQEKEDQIKDSTIRITTEEVQVDRQIDLQKLKIRKAKATQKGGKAQC